MMPAASTPPRSTGADRFSSDAIAILLLAILAVWLFRGHVFGDSLWIGNPDRLNGDLKYLRHYLFGLTRVGIAAWNEHEMMGYDSFAMAGTSTNPLVYLVGLFGEASSYVNMGYFAVGLLVCAAIATYCFLRSFLPAGMPALVGAICYEFSALTILKLSQNSMSFAVFIVIPAVALAIRHIRRESTAWCFLALTVLLGCMLNYMFLQKAAYALMFAGTYSAWRSYSAKSWRPIVVFSVALGTAVAFSFPRIITVGLALVEYRRAIAGVDLQNFDALYEFQNIHPYELLRWLDNSIFGRSPSDAYSLSNNVNLTEGFLLYTSAIVPPLLLVGLLRNARSWLAGSRVADRDPVFLFWMMISCVAVIAFKPVAHAVFLFFLSLDFTHARILIAALLPLCVLVALTLQDISPEDDRRGAIFRQRAMGLGAGMIIALAIEAVSVRFSNTVPLTSLIDGPLQASSLRVEALGRIGLSIAAFLVLLWICLASKVGRRTIAHAAICALIATQCLLAVNTQVNGPQAHGFQKPFLHGDFYHARREEFALPSDEQMRVLHQRVEPQRYRVGLICDQTIADGFCAGHVPEFWQLRSIDGYYGPGVPRRLRALPWPNGVSLRTISFVNLKDVPWDLLGLLNVRWVLLSGDGVFRNIVRDGDKITGRPDPATFEVVPSPARVTPRAFFVETVKPATSPEDAARQLFSSGRIVDPMKTSFVEGLGAIRGFGEGGGAIELQGRDDFLELHFAASSSERFLVLNELYYPGWTAETNERELPILATNAVMRGVVVPPGVNTLQFRYVSYLRSAQSWAFRISATLIMLGLFFALRRYARS
jgi:hypothetical protein